MALSPSADPKVVPFKKNNPERNNATPETPQNRLSRAASVAPLQGGDAAGDAGG